MSNHYESTPGSSPKTAPIALDLCTTAWTDALRRAPLYQKTGRVLAKLAVPGEVVHTVLADGTIETVNTAKQGQMLLTGSRGEHYLLSTEAFTQRYSPTGAEGVYTAKGKIRALPNPTGQLIVITARWGEKQYGDSDCMIATHYNPDAPDVVGTGRYIIGAAEFAETYVLVSDQAGQE